MAAPIMHPGVTVKCPVCLELAPPETEPVDPKAPFRCQSCKRRSSETLVRLQEQEKKGLLKHGQSISDDHVPPDTASPEGSRGRNRPTESKPAQSANK